MSRRRQPRAAQRKVYSGASYSGLSKTKFEIVVLAKTFERDQHGDL